MSERKYINELSDAFHLRGEGYNEHAFIKSLASVTLLFETDKYAIIGDSKGEVKRCGKEFLNLFRSHLSKQEVKFIAVDTDKLPVYPFPIGTSEDIPPDKILITSLVKNGISGHFRYGFDKEDNKYYIVELSPGSGVYFEEAEKFPFFMY